MAVPMVEWLADQKVDRMAATMVEQSDEPLVAMMV